jgi:putative polyhydroxyalkanoate system protein
MAKISLQYNHQLGYGVAYEKLANIAQDLSDRLDADYYWEDSRLMFSRSGANGWLQVGDDEIAVEITLGRVLSLMKGKIERTIDDGIKDLLS